MRLKRLADGNAEHHVGLLADLFALDVEIGDLDEAATDESRS